MNFGLNRIFKRCCIKFCTHIRNDRSNFLCSKHVRKVVLATRINRNYRSFKAQSTTFKFGRDYDKSLQIATYDSMFALIHVMAIHFYVKYRASFKRPFKTIRK